MGGTFLSMLGQGLMGGMGGSSMGASMPQGGGRPMASISGGGQPMGGMPPPMQAPTPPQRPLGIGLPSTPPMPPIRPSGLGGAGAPSPPPRPAGGVAPIPSAPAGTSSSPPGFRDNLGTGIGGSIGGPKQKADRGVQLAGPVPTPDTVDKTALDYRERIASIESSGSGGYNAVNSKTGAVGRYQVMPANVGPWTKEVLGKAMTPEEFKNDHAAQDKVFDAKFGQSVKKYGNPSDAASVWFTGKPASAGANKSDGSTTGAQYVALFNKGPGKGKAALIARAGRGGSTTPTSGGGGGTFTMPGRTKPGDVTGGKGPDLGQTQSQQEQKKKDENGKEKMGQGEGFESKNYVEVPKGVEPAPNLLGQRFASFQDAVKSKKATFKDLLDTA